MNNLQAEVTECIVYYNFIVNCTPEDSIYAARKKELKEIIDDQMKFAHLIGQKICMTEDAMLARVELDTKRQGKIIQDSCVNLDSLTKLNADRCKFVVENADAVLNEYMKK